MEIKVAIKANDGRLVKVSARQAKAIEELANTRKGGCGSVIGYRPTSNWITPPVHDIQLISHFSMANLYKRRKAALEAVAYGDVAAKVAANEKFGGMKASEVLEIFEDRKSKMIASLTNTLDGGPTNAHQDAHKLCYAHFGGVKVHLETKKVGDHKEPVITDGTVVCESILIPYLELNVTVREPGEHKKPPNSGAPVLMGKFIEGCLNARSVGFKQLSLKEDNFESFRTDRKEFLPEDVNRFGDIITE